jgi:hypothetical protein
MNEWVAQVSLLRPGFSGETELSSRPERTPISCFALLATSTYTALRRESRMQILNATALDRKCGGAQWRDLRFLPLSRSLFTNIPSHSSKPTANVNLQHGRCS